MTQRDYQSAQLCNLPKNITFEFVEDQQMHTVITIYNLVDQIISYKIKTNKQGLYLVKPTEGQIYNKSSIKINIQRRSLTTQNFNIIKANPGQIKQKFLVELSCTVTDNIGRTKNLQQISYLSVNFTSRTNNNRIDLSQEFLPSDNSKLINDYSNLISEKKKQYEKLISQKQKILATKLRDSITFDLQDLIHLLVFFYLLGFAVQI